MRLLRGMSGFVNPNSKAVMINRKLGVLYGESGRLHAKLAEVNFEYSEQVSKLTSLESLDALVKLASRINELVSNLASVEKEIKESIDQLGVVDEHYSEFLGDYMLCIKVNRMSIDELEELIIEHEDKCQKPKHSCEFGELVRMRLTELTSMGGN